MYSKLQRTWWAIFEWPVNSQFKKRCLCFTTCNHSLLNAWRPKISCWSRRCISLKCTGCQIQRKVVSLVRFGILTIDESCFVQRSSANLKLDTSTFLPLLDNKCYEILQVSVMFVVVECRGSRMAGCSGSGHAGCSAKDLLAEFTAPRQSHKWAGIMM